MLLLNQPISGRYFKIFVEFLGSKNSGVRGAARTLRQPKIGVHTKRYIHLTPKTRVDTQRPTLRLTNCPNIHWIVAGSSFSFSPSANPSVSCFNSDTIAPRLRQASVFSGLMAIARS